MYKYAHGGDIYGSSNKIPGLLDYSVNINPLGLPESVKKAVQNSLRDCENYPDPFCRKLTAKIVIFLIFPQNIFFVAMVLRTSCSGLLL
jgi:threonine-phosphate decarboxylase